MEGYPYPSGQPISQLTGGLLQGCSSYQHGGDDERPICQRVGDIRASAFGDLRDIEPLGRTPHSHLDRQTDTVQGLSPQCLHPFFISASNSSCSHLSGALSSLTSFEPTFLTTLLPSSFPEEAPKMLSLLNSPPSPFAGKPIPEGREMQREKKR